MAHSNMTTSVTLENFRMPSEPHPLPSLGSDEESFVILGKSMSPEVDTPLSGGVFDPASVTVIEEARRLLNNEISMMEQMSLNRKAMHESSKGDSPSSLKNDVQKDQSKLSVTEQLNGVVAVKCHSLDTSGMEQPEMPDMKKSLLSGFPEIQNLQKWSFDDLPSEEVQGKISQIIDENVHLKDTLLQNNMSMKSQYDRIIAWQEDVQKVHQAHRQKLVEAKEFIEKLKADNSMVKRQLEKSNELAEKQQKEIAGLKMMLEESKRLNKEKISQSSDDNIKEFELDSANKKNKELEAALKTLMQENTVLKLEMSKLEPAETEKLMQENSVLKNVNMKLTEAVEKHNVDMEQIQQKCGQLEQELGKTRNHLAERDWQLNKMYNESMQSKVSAPELTNLRSQLANTQAMLTQVEQSRAVAYAQIAMMTDQIRDLTSKAESLKTESHRTDEIFALQTQLEVYKADFEAEKNAKEVVKEEKDKLVEDLQNLQRRNQQLQEEIEMARENRDYVVFPSNSRTAPSASNQHMKKCPKCSFGFTSMQALENHVYRCLELDDHLP